MLENFEQQLHQIITLSQQMLLALSNDVESSDNSTKEIEPAQLVSLNVERDKLIKLTFKEQQSNNYTQYLALINEVVALDHQLIQQAETKKLALKTSLLTLKKNQKAANSYKKC